MKRSKKTIQVMILVLFVLLGGYTITSGLFEDKESLPEVGQPVPSFQLSTLEGDVLQIEDFKGHPVVINFWGSFCEPCVREMPLIQAYHEKYAEDGLIILGINLNEPKLSVEAFAKQMGVTFPILLDPGGETRKRYGVTSFPTTFFLDKDGNLVSEKVGEMTELDMRSNLSRILDVPVL